MRGLRELAILTTATMLVTGCPKAPAPPAADSGAKAAPTAAAAGALAPDKDYSSGTVQGAALSFETKLDVPGFGDSKLPAELQAARAASVLKQDMQVSDARGRMIFTTEDSYVPKGTEVRYRPDTKRYVLADPTKKQYWVMSGSELGNLLEGGPSMTRDGYSISIEDTKETAKIAGVDATRTNATVGFDWKVKTRSGDKSGKIKVNIGIWHTADARLKPAWGTMMVDFLTVPFQDPAGQKVVDQLKSKVKFPVKWAMEVVGENAPNEEQAKDPTLVTTAVSLEVKDLPKGDLAYPPPGYGPAAGPYTFSEGAQTVAEDLLAKLPAKKGTPPKDLEAPTVK